MNKSTKKRSKVGNIEIDTQGKTADKAILNMNGINTIKGSIANNGGTINVGGDLTLEGAIKGTGNVSFKNGSSLTTALDDTVKIDAQTVTIGDASLNLILDPNITAKTYNFIEADNISGAFKIADNGLYSFKQEGGKIVATEKSSAEIAIRQYLKEHPTAQIKAEATTKQNDKRKAEGKERFEPGE